MGWFDKNAPVPGDAIHIAPNLKRSLCGQSMKGEKRMPDGTAPTCPVCLDIAER